MTLRDLVLLEKDAEGLDEAPVKTFVIKKKCAPGEVRSSDGASCTSVRGNPQDIAKRKAFSAGSLY